MQKQEILNKAEKYIKYGTMSDLDEIMAFVFDLSVLLLESEEKYVMTKNNQELARDHLYIEMKHGIEKMTENEMNKMSNVKSKTDHERKQYEVDYKFYSRIIKMLDNRMIVIQSLNKEAKKMDGGF